jgi:hypothetical protein
MIAPLLILLMTLAAQPQSDPLTMQQRAHEEYERHKQAAIRINELGQQIHSESDASTFIAEIAAIFAKELPPAWATGGTRQRLARAEYESVRNSANLIPEQRIVDVWNQYVRQIGASNEALVTAAEIHNLRDAEFTAAQYFWARGNQTIWTVPNIYALDADGKVADGCRAVEAVRVIYDLYRFQNLIGARDRVARGIVASEEVKKHAADSPHPRTVGYLEAHADINPVCPAERRYLQEHGPVEYERLLKSLFEELFPAE